MEHYTQQCHLIHFRNSLIEALSFYREYPHVHNEITVLNDNIVLRNPIKHSYTKCLNG